MNRGVYDGCRVQGKRSSLFVLRQVYVVPLWVPSLVLLMRLKFCNCDMFCFHWYFYYRCFRSYYTSNYMHKYMILYYGTNYIRCMFEDIRSYIINRLWYWENYSRPCQCNLSMAVLYIGCIPVQHMYNAYIRSIAKHWHESWSLDETSNYNAIVSGYWWNTVIKYVKIISYRRPTALDGLSFR